MPCSKRPLARGLRAPCQQSTRLPPCHPGCTPWAAARPSPPGKHRRWATNSAAGRRAGGTAAAAWCARAQARGGPAWKPALHPPTRRLTQPRHAAAAAAAAAALRGQGSAPLHSPARRALPLSTTCLHFASAPVTYPTARLPRTCTHRQSPPTPPLHTAPTHRHDGVPLRGLQAAEGAQVGLHAREVKHAQGVVVRPRQQPRPAVVQVQRGHHLALACAHPRCRPAKQVSPPNLEAGPAAAAAAASRAGRQTSPSLALCREAVMRSSCPAALPRSSPQGPGLHAALCGEAPPTHTRTRPRCGRRSRSAARPSAAAAGRCLPAPSNLTSWLMGRLYGSDSSSGSPRPLPLPPCTRQRGAAAPRPGLERCRSAPALAKFHSKLNIPPEINRGNEREGHRGLGCTCAHRRPLLLVVGRAVSPWLRRAWRPHRALVLAPALLRRSRCCRCGALRLGCRGRRLGYHLLLLAGAAAGGRAPCSSGRGGRGCTTLPAGR